MNNFWKQVFSISLGITTTGFSFIPEDCFQKVIQWQILPPYWNDTVNKICFFITVGVVVGLILRVYRCCRKSVEFKGPDYKIIVEYGNIFDKEKCNKVIPFDECYTTEVGRDPHQIKSSSICGQFLNNLPLLNLENLIQTYSIKPLRKLSKFNGKNCYESGTLIPYEDYWLMAFGKLNADGRAEMSKEEYLNSLFTLWENMTKYFTQTDVAIPVIGAGITHFKDCSLSQQQLVDLIISSYKISPHKLKLPNKLYIVCKESPDFSLNKVGSSL